MNRYFIEVAYRGSGFAGFQVQENAITIQSEIEKAFRIYFRTKFALTGSSRTDAGVHALQNYFHFDSAVDIDPATMYNINALLPASIVVKSLHAVRAEAHCRFDAVSREYKYHIYFQKNPFLADRGYYYPYTLNKQLLAEAAALYRDYTDFTSFSKRRTQVKTYVCHISRSEWSEENGCLVFNVEADRFLRGMIRGMVGTMLQVGREKIDAGRLREIIEAKDASLADFAVPAHGLFLVRVNYPDKYFE